MSAKTCSRCKQAKVLSEFNKHRASRDGLSWTCKACNKETSAANRAKHPGRGAAQMREWRRNNIERARASEQAWKERNPERAAFLKRRSHLKQYGITPEQYDVMLAAQGARVPFVPSRPAINCWRLTTTTVAARMPAAPAAGVCGGCSAPSATGSLDGLRGVCPRS